MNRTMLRVALRCRRVGFVTCGSLAHAAAQPDPWPDLAKELFNGRPLADGSGLIAIEMPAAPRMPRSCR